MRRGSCHCSRKSFRPGVKPVIDPQQEIRVSVDFLKSYLKAHPFIKTTVLGISGGQDSTLTGKLAQTAITELREETGDHDYSFIAVRLPYGVQADEQDCQDALAFIQPDRTLVVNIKEAVLASERARCRRRALPCRILCAVTRKRANA